MSEGKIEAKTPSVCCADTSPGSPGEAGWIVLCVWKVSWGSEI